MAADRILMASPKMAVALFQECVPFEETPVPSLRTARRTREVEDPLLCRTCKAKRRMRMPAPNCCANQNRSFLGEYVRHCLTL